MASLPNNLISPDEYLRLDRVADIRSEYIAGEMVAMSGGSRNHSRIKSEVERLLGNQLEGRPCETHSSDLRVNVGAAFFYPDIAIVCGQPQFLDGAYLDTLTNPTVIVEVLSPSTEAYDRGTKFYRYAQIPSLQDYVLIAQDKVRVEHFSRHPDGEWGLPVTYTDAELTLRLPSIDCGLTIASIYAKVELPG